MVFDPRAAKLLKQGESIAITTCPGLRLKASKLSKSWVYRYRNPAGVLKMVKLGNWPAMPMGEAYIAWENARKQREAGTDLVQARAEQKQAQQKALTALDLEYRVQALVSDFVEGHLKQSRKPEGARAAERILLSALEEFPDFGKMPAREVQRQHAFALLDARKNVPTVAQKLRSLMGSAWSYALDAGRLDGDVPNWWLAVMKGRLKSKGKLIGGKHQGKKRRVLSDEEVATLLRWAPDNWHSVAVDTMEMYLWTGTRGSEILAMKPEHLSEKDGVLWWTIPKELTKNERFEFATDLRVPLFGRAQQIVKRRVADAKKGEFLFCGADGQPYLQKFFSTYVYDWQPYSPKSKREGKARGVLPVTDWTPHNLRRTTRTMLAALGCPREIGEAVLGHMPPEIEATYNEYSYDAERVEWLSKLSEKLESMAKA